MVDVTRHLTLCTASLHVSLHVSLTLFLSDLCYACYSCDLSTTMQQPHASNETTSSPLTLK